MLDRERARPYMPIEMADLVFDLAAVHRPHEALAFVQRYGLLRHGPDAAESRERFSDFEREALSLSNTLGLYLLIRRATEEDAEDATEAIGDLWELAPAFEDAFDKRPANRDELVDQATQLVAYWTNEGLEGVEYMVAPSAHYIHPAAGAGRVGDFSLSAHLPTLLGAAYHQLALEITNRVLLRACAECGKYFAVKDKRQRFCTSTCGSRARQRRWTEKQESPSE